MAVTLSTPTLSLNDGVRYGLISIDLGANKREEIVIEPFGADVPILAKVVNRRSIVTISLVVTGHTTAGDVPSAAKLQANVEAVRNQFNGQPNSITYSMGGVTKTITTYDSQIDPVPIDHIFTVAGTFLIPTWTFQVVRDAVFQGDTRPPVI